MKKFICVALLICAGTMAFAQEIIINGTTKNRPLTWDDFKALPDQNSYTMQILFGILPTTYTE